MLCRGWLFMTPWTVPCQAPLSMKFSRQNTRLCCHPLFQRSSKPRNESMSPASLALAGIFFTTEAPGKPTMEYYSAIKKNEIMPFAATWMDPKIIILSEVRERQMYYNWNLMIPVTNKWTYKWYKWTYLQNRNGLIDTANKFKITKKGSRERDK